MKRLLLETSFSKIYMLVMIIITLLILGSYFSYAMFTVTKEKSNAISIVTGSLNYKLEVDGSNSNTLTVSPNSSKDFIITLSNPNNRIARFNFYYIGDIPSDVEIGYLNEEGINIPPVETGMNLEKIDTSGSSNTYKIRVNNISSNSVTINLGVSVGLDYNDLVLPSDGHLFKEYEGVELYKVLLKDSKNNINTSDSEQIFITGENPNNYIWYSGKIWRAVSIDPADNSVKLVTQWNISAIPYDDNSSSFKGSHMEMWLNDTSVDGFLGNLREPENFIKMDSKWNATMTTETSKPPKTTTVENPVGLLNIYEYVMSYTGTTPVDGYLNNMLWWRTITPTSDGNIYSINYSGGIANNLNSHHSIGIRPTINLRSGIKTVDGKGTEEDPYRLAGDNDRSLSGTFVSSRYSGEYITFGTGENTLYRIVSHEVPGLTKITSAEPLKENGKFKALGFDNSSSNYSIATTMGTFLNGDYLINYLTVDQASMIEDNTLWYLGTVGPGINYRLSKYNDSNMSSLVTNRTSVEIGLLRLGELMAGQFNDYNKNIHYWTLTKNSSSAVRCVNYDAGGASSNFALSTNYGIRPTFNLKSNVQITSGIGTKSDPFVLSLGS